MPFSWQWKPAGHGRHHVSLVAWASGLCVVTPHSTSTLLPGQYCPGKHGMGMGLPSSHVNPGGHDVQSDCFWPPTRARTVPLLHGRGTVMPSGQ